MHLQLTSKNANFFWFLTVLTHPCTEKVCPTRDSPPSALPCSRVLEGLTNQ